MGAVVLFRFLKSSAIIKKEAYQAGGAVAGFVIIYSLLFTSYYEVEKLNNQELESEIVKLGEQIQGLQDELTPVDVSGDVEPDREPVKVRLVFDATEPDSDGKFSFQVPRILLKSNTAAIYAITDDEHVLYDTQCHTPPCPIPESTVHLFAARLDDIKIPVQLRRR
jgi:hypothetical protein